MSEHPVKIDCLLYVRNADKTDSTPWSSNADCYVKRCEIAYAFLNAFGASGSHLDDFFDGLSILTGTHKVGCPKFLTKFEPCFVVPDQNDARRSQNFCGEHGTESYCTVADDSHSFSRVHSALIAAWYPVPITSVNGSNRVRSRSSFEACSGILTRVPSANCARIASA